MSCVDIYVGNGISRYSLDVCFGDQLAGSAHEPMHRGWHHSLDVCFGDQLAGSAH